MCAPEDEEDGEGEGVGGGRATAERAENGRRSHPPALDAGGGRCRGGDSGWERLRRATSCARPGVEVHDGNTADRGDGRRLLRVVWNRPRRRCLPVSGVSTYAEHAGGAELGEEGRGNGWGGQNARCHKPTGATGIGSRLQPDTTRERKTLVSWMSRRQGTLLLLLLAGDYSRGRQPGMTVRRPGYTTIVQCDFITQQSKSGNSKK